MQEILNYKGQPELFLPLRDCATQVWSDLSAAGELALIEDVGLLLLLSGLYYAFRGLNEWRRPLRENYASLFFLARIRVHEDGKEPRQSTMGKEAAARISLPVDRETGRDAECDGSKGCKKVCFELGPPRITLNRQHEDDGQKE